MYAVVRRYSGPGAKELFDLIETRGSEVEGVIRAVSGFKSYSLLRTAEGGLSVTVCKDKAGTDESLRVASEWVKKNQLVPTQPPDVSEGNLLLHLD